MSEGSVGRVAEFAIRLCTTSSIYQRAIDLMKRCGCRISILCRAEELASPDRCAGLGVVEQGLIDPMYSFTPS